MTNTLLGRPINGKISHYGRSNTPEQWSIEKFLEQLDAIFAFGDVKAVRWHQYTPYFNDGDACEFTIYEPRILIDGIDEDAGEYSDGYLTTYDVGDWPDGYWNTHSWYPSGGKLRASYADRIPGFEASDPHGILGAFSALAESINHYELKLREVFGDPAEVTATREGFNVEHYDHD